MRHEDIADYWRDQLWEPIGKVKNPGVIKTGNN